MEADALVREYLGRLELAAQVLPAGRRRELRVEIGEHIEAALAETTSRDEVAVRNVLERLGPPEDIVAAEVGPSPASAAPSQAGALEIGALALLAGGAMLTPVFGVAALVLSMVGLVLVWSSAAWTSRQKRIATVIMLGMPFLTTLLLLALLIGFGSL